MYVICSKKVWPPPFHQWNVPFISCWLRDKKRSLKVSERRLWVKASRRTSYWQNHLSCLPSLFFSLFHIDILESFSSHLPTHRLSFLLPLSPSVCPHLYIDRVFMGSVINVTSSFYFSFSLIFCLPVIFSPFCLLFPLLTSPSTPPFSLPPPYSPLPFILPILIPLFLLFLHYLFPLFPFHPPQYFFSAKFFCPLHLDLFYCDPPIFLFFLQDR